MNPQPVFFVFTVARTLRRVPHPSNGRTKRRAGGSSPRVNLVAARFVDGEQDDEGRSSTYLRFKGNGPAVLVHNDRMSDSKALTGPFAYTLGGEKWIENPV